MKIYHAISIDLAQSDAMLPTVVGVEGDSGTHVLELHLLCGGEAWTIPEDASVLLSYVRADGTGGTYDTLPDGGKAWQIRDNVLYVELAQACFAVPTLPQEEMRLTVTLLRDNQQLTTRRIALAVERSLMGSDEESATYTSLVSLIHRHIGDLTLLETENKDDLVAAVNEVLGKCQQSLVSVESVRISESGELLVTLTDGQVLSAGTLEIPSAEGGVSSVCGKSPDSAGNVAVTAEDVAALPLSGGTMTGDVSMGGHTVTGLADPVNDTDAVSKAWVESYCSNNSGSDSNSGNDSGASAECTALHVNPNLLDNWCFIRPVDQRGQGEYSGIGYGFDRWVGTSRTSTYLSSGTLVLTCQKTYSTLSQFIENPTMLSGNTVAVSALLTANTGGFVLALERVRNGDVVTLSQVLSDESGLVSFTYTLGAYDLEDGDKLRVSMGNSSSSYDQYQIVGVKLEIGSQQTLAHQVNSAWLLRELPNHAQQLQRCQRYFQIFRTSDLRPEYAADFRPTLAAEPSFSTIDINGETYYAASAEL